MASYFSHDSNARNDEKILALRMRHGWEGYGLYWALIEKLRDSADYTCVKDYNVIAFDLRTDAAKVKSVVEDFGLFAFTDDGKRVYSDSLNRRMSQREDISEARRNAALRRWKIDDECKSNANALQKHSKKMQKQCNKIKENKININSSSTTSAPAPVNAVNENFSKKNEAAAGNANDAICDVNSVGAVDYSAGKRKLATAEENARKCLESSVWVEAVCMQHHLTPERVAEELRLFPSHLTQSGYDEDKPLDDFKRHFTSYLRKKLAAEALAGEKTKINGNHQKESGCVAVDPYEEYRRRHDLD